MKLINKLKNLIFPNACLYCNRIINESSFFCLTCWPDLQFITNPKCNICSYPLEFEGITNICIKCQQSKPHYDQNISIFRYDKIIKRIISSLKYQDQQYLARKLAKLLIQNSKLDFAKFDIIICVPSHKKQLQKRKYNPSALLAKNICKITKNPNFQPNLLLKVKNTQPQAKLTKKQRLVNLNSAFKINPKFQQLVKNQSILIIDDVTTTQSTLNEISKTLKKLKPQNITTLTIAKAF